MIQALLCLPSYGESTYMVVQEQWPCRPAHSASMITSLVQCAHVCRFGPMHTQK